MRRLLLGVILAALSAGGGAMAETGGQAAKADDHPMVALETSMGRIVLRLYPEKAPLTVANFLEYVEADFFNGTIFHRVVPNFVIQGGGFTETMSRKETRPPIRNEAARGLKNKQYTISMARTGDPHSATSQFFISLRDNTESLDPHPEDPSRQWGYCAFGEVVEGQAVVDAVGKVKTETRAGMKDVPAVPVLINTAKVIRPEAPEDGKTGS
ncbi:MAG: peptidyl-prolyl cis-trans isomerase [Candidatus Eisenbacteria bacterium]|uniref:Peptidyl-prolyl cis-trans isomerase n=1 Tax=Eiseniibacteriota bacterium TaxID=2212470 RepID=A0A937XEE6_UNCEI|nr:peptidyl-prolyl cis-trans isomerase [Candidatus Eisenbacteria bacterium]